MKLILVRQFIWLAISYIGLTIQSVKADDGQLWLSAKGLAWESESGKTQIRHHSEARFRRDMQTFHEIFFAPSVHYSVNDYLTMSSSVRLVKTKDSQGTWATNYRGQLQITPQLRLGESQQYKLAFRNRVERLTGDDEQIRRRHRLTLSRKINGQWIQGVYSSLELFFVREGGRDDFDEYRYIPLATQLALNEDIKLNVFTMVSRENNVQGTYEYTLGLDFRF